MISIIIPVYNVERFEWIGSRFPGLRRKYLRRDVELFHYFAQDFPFDRETAKKFRALAWYYLGQCLRYRPGVQTLRACLGLLRYSEKRLTGMPPVKEEAAKETYFP